MLSKKGTKDHKEKMKRRSGFPTPDPYYTFNLKEEVKEKE